MSLDEKCKVQVGHQLFTVEFKREVFFHLVNSSIAGALVFLGSFTANSQIGWKTVAVSVASAGVVCLTKFQSFWKRYLKKPPKSIGKGAEAMLFSFV